MKKKLLLLLFIIPALLLVVTGCGKKEEKKPVENNTKTIELTDKKFGYKTTFTYDKSENYSDIDVDTDSGRTTEIEFENEELDVEFEMYYTDMRSTTYKETQEIRSKQKYYKEYNFGKYKAYAYGEYSSSIHLNILIDTDQDTDMAKIIFVEISRMDTNEDIVIADVVSGKKIQALLNSIEVKKIS